MMLLELGLSQVQGFASEHSKALAGPFLQPLRSL